MFISRVPRSFSPEVVHPSRMVLEGNSNIKDPDSGSDEIEPTFSGSAPAGEVLNEINMRLISSLHEGVIVYDRDLKYVLWNPFMEEMTGLPAQEVLGKHHSDFFPFVKEQGLDRLIESALDGNSVATPDFTFYVPGSGKSGWASANYGPLHDWKGDIVGVLATVEDITRRKLTEEALAHSEERYRNVVEKATDVVYMLSMDGTIIALNQAFENLTGWSRADWIGGSFLGLVHPDDLTLASELIRRVYGGQPAPAFELRFRSKGGEYLVGECTVAPQIENGRVVAASGMVRDVTARKQSEEALRQASREYRSIFENALESEEKYRELVENINDVVFATDEQGTVTYMSPIVEVNAGYKPSELVGRSFLEVVYPEDRAMLRERFRDAVTGEVEPLEYRIVAKSGDVRWVRSSSRAVVDDGRVVGLRGVIADITKHKRVEAHLERLATAVEQAAESIVITDTEGKIQYINPAFERTTGYSQAEVVGETPRILNSGRHDASFYREMWNTIVRGEVWTGRFTNKRKDGTLFEEEATISPVRDGSGRIVNFVAVKRDVTREVELEKQLLHAQKMEAIGRLAGGVAHDFNNLLTAIIGYSQIVKGRLGADHPLGSEVDEILAAGHRAAALTSQLLAFSRRQTLTARNINLNDTIGNLMNLLRRIIGEDVDLCYQSCADLHQVFADAGKIEQVIMNMAVNSRDSMPDGGRLNIETSNVTLDDAYCREHLWARPGEYVQISVSDSGAGMDSETQLRIFEPFFTTKEVGKGTGLGLSVVYGIVKQHDGLIDVHSEPGHGTTFRLYLKALLTATPEQRPTPQGPPRGGSETILVAEDEETLRELARAVLGSLGYRVLLANDGEEAVLAFEAARNEIDLVILDLVMPRMGGREASERMRELGGDFPVIFMTGYIPDMLKDELPGASASLLIQKPYAVYELGRRVREVLDAQSAVSTKPLN